MVLCVRIVFVVYFRFRLLIRIFRGVLFIVWIFKFVSVIFEVIKRFDIKCFLLSRILNIFVFNESM